MDPEAARLAARLALEAVLPAAAELVGEGDPVARACVHGPLRVGFAAGDLGAGWEGGLGSLRWVPSARGQTLRLEFHTPARLAAFFSGDLRALPQPVAGVWRWWTMLRAARLLLRLRQALEEPGRVPVEQRVRLGYGVAARALPIVSALDPAARRILAHSPAGVAHLAIPDAGVSLHLRVGAGGVEPASASDPARVGVTLTSLEAAVAALEGRSDGPADVARGRVRVEGFLPLADALDALLARVDRWLRPPGRAHSRLATGRGRV